MTNRFAVPGRRSRMRCSMAIASATAVASSNSDALAASMDVRSCTIVWKLSSPSSRPWATSA